MSESKQSPPSWMFRESRPPNDNVYFENLTRSIFQAGLSWKMIDTKWPNFLKAFENFSIDKVAKFDQRDFERLMNDKSIVRNRQKIEATIFNAKQFKTIQKEANSFQSYFDGLDKSQNFKLVIKELSKKFHRVGPSTANIFLFSVGENISQSDE